VAFSDTTIKLLDIGVKGGLGIVLTVLATFYGYRLNDQREKESEQSRRIQAIVDLTSKQKDLDVQLAVQMFSTLTSNYFSKDAATADRQQLSRQILLLSLVALNFQDVPIQLRPLFEDLDRQLTRPEDKKRLRDVAQEVAARQAFRLTVGGGYNSGPRTVKSGDVIEVPELLATVAIESVEKESIRAVIDSKFAAAGRVGPFNVGYFVWPITDNTKLGELRVCVLLLDTAPGQATIRVIAFGSELAADRFDIKELSRALRDKP
jgi:hypothetical protein